MRLLTGREARVYFESIDSGYKSPDENTSGYFKEHLGSFIAFRGNFETITVPSKQLAYAFCTNLHKNHE